MKKETYVSPQTCYTEVELESGFMIDSVINEGATSKEDVTAGNQGIGDNFDFTDQEQENVWN